LEAFHDAQALGIAQGLEKAGTGARLELL